MSVAPSDWASARWAGFRLRVMMRAAPRRRPETMAHDVPRPSSDGGDHAAGLTSALTAMWWPPPSDQQKGLERAVGRAAAERVLTERRRGAPRRTSLLSAPTACKQASMAGRSGWWVRRGARRAPPTGAPRNSDQLWGPKSARSALWRRNRRLTTCRAGPATEGFRRTRPFHARGSAAHPGSAGWHAPPPRRPASRTRVRSPRHESSGPPPPSPGP